MSVHEPPPRIEGLHTLAPEIIRIVEALARVVEERDYQISSSPSNPGPGDDRQPRQHR